MVGIHRVAPTGFVIVLVFCPQAPRPRLSSIVPDGDFSLFYLLSGTFSCLTA